MAYKIYRDAMVPEPTHSVRDEEGNFVVVYRKDRANALNALKYADAALVKREELDTLKLKKAESEGIEEISKEWKLEDGLG